MLEPEGPREHLTRMWNHVNQKLMQLSHKANETWNRAQGSLKMSGEVYEAIIGVWDFRLRQYLSSHVHVRIDIQQPFLIFCIESLSLVLTPLHFQDYRVSIDTNRCFCVDGFLWRESPKTFSEIKKHFSLCSTAINESFPRQTNSWDDFPRCRLLPIFNEQFQRVTFFYLSERSMSFWTGLESKNIFIFIFSQTLKNPVRCCYPMATFQLLFFNDKLFTKLGISLIEYPAPEWHTIELDKSKRNGYF